MIEDHFAKEHHEIQETGKNCFWSKKWNASLREAETGKQMAAIYNIAI